jgi:hypothetical protein
VSELTAQEREFVIWALHYVEGAAQEMHDDETGKRAHEIAQKIRAGS